MPIGLYGTLYPRRFPEVIPAQGPAFDTAHIEQRAMEHEAAGFDGVLLPHNSGWSDNFLTTARAAGVTRRLKFLLAHLLGLSRPRWRPASSPRSTTTPAVGCCSISSLAAVTPSNGAYHRSG